MSLAILGMVILRLLSGCMEITAAMLILKLNNLEQALKINALLASLGPLIFIGVMYLGLTGLARELSFNRAIFIYAGVALIFWGLRS